MANRIYLTNTSALYYLSSLLRATHGLNYTILSNQAYILKISTSAICLELLLLIYLKILFEFRDFNSILIIEARFPNL